MTSSTTVAMHLLMCFHFIISDFCIPLLPYMLRCFRVSDGHFGSGYMWGGDGGSGPFLLEVQTLTSHTDVVHVR